VSTPAERRIKARENAIKKLNDPTELNRLKRSRGHPLVREKAVQRYVTSTRQQIKRLRAANAAEGKTKKR
jgi:hypothetical protein